MDIPRHHAYLITGDTTIVESVLRDFILPVWDVSRDRAEVITYSVGLAKKETIAMIRSEAAQPGPADGLRVIVFSATTLPEELQNALLKILEEPAPRAVVVLALPAGSTVLDTIRSRVAIIPPARGASVSGDAKTFLKSSFADRFAMIAEWKETGEDDSDTLRARAHALAQNVCEYVSGQILIQRKAGIQGKSSHSELLIDLQFVLEGLGQRGAPVGQLLDFLAMTVPEKLTVIG
jgi:hypothetical protein